MNFKHLLILQTIKNLLQNDEFNLLILKEKYLVYYDDELRKFVIPDDIFNHIKGLKVTDEHSREMNFIISLSYYLQEEKLS